MLFARYRQKARLQAPCFVEGLYWPDQQPLFQSNPGPIMPMTAHSQRRDARYQPAE